MLSTEQKITPLLWFDSEAEKAINFYVSIFDNSKIDEINRFDEDGPGPQGRPMMIEFTLEGQEFMALNGGAVSDLPVTDVPPRGGIALFMSCETQAELDRVWDRLAEGGHIQQCGWLRDKFGVAWNIVPRGMGEYIGHDDPEKRARAMKAMLQMKKLDLEEIRKATEGA